MGFISDRATNRKPRPRTVSKFMKLEEGKPVVVQILDDTACEYYKYWFKDPAGRWIGYASPGYDTCPIAARNRAVGGRESPQYIKPQYKYAVNVLDLTPVVKCPECGSVYTTNPGNCPSCDTYLAGVKLAPMSEVRIMEAGSRLFSQIKNLADGTPVLDADGNPTGEFTPIVVDAEGNRLNITTYCVQIIRTGSGGDTTYTAVPMLHLTAVDASDYDELLHKLPAGIDLTDEEILAILDDDVLLSDIYAARRAERETNKKAAGSVEELTEDVLF